MRLECCAGVEAERFNRSRSHVRVTCWSCLTSFCLDRRDVEAEEREHRPSKREPDQGTRRRWYCSGACLNRGRQALGVNLSDEALEAKSRNAAKAREARKRPS